MPPTVKCVGYTRVSTAEQEQGGYSLDAQAAAIRAECKRRRWELITVEQDVASGKSFDRRPGLQRALAMVRSGEADALVAWKLDRISRSLLNVAQLLVELQRPRVFGHGRTQRKLDPWQLVLLSDNGLDTTTPEGEASLGQRAVWAQLERRLISQRTKLGLLRAREQPKPGKRPIGRAPRVPLDVCKMIVRLRGPERKPQRSWNEIADELNRRKVKTPSGVPWRASTVRPAYLRATTGYARGRSRFES